MVSKCLTFVLKYKSGINDIGKQDRCDDRDQICDIQLQSTFTEYKKADQIDQGRASSKKYISDHIVLVKTQDHIF